MIQSIMSIEQKKITEIEEIQIEINNVLKNKNKAFLYLESRSVVYS